MPLDFGGTTFLVQAIVQHRAAGIQALDFGTIILIQAIIQVDSSNRDPESKANIATMGVDSAQCSKDNRRAHAWPTMLQIEQHCAITIMHSRRRMRC